MKLPARAELPLALDSLPLVFLSSLNQVKAEIVKEVAAARRKQHLSSLQYYCALNALQYRKRVAMVEPMLGFAHGQVGLSPAPRPQT